MIVASWDLTAETENERELPPIKFHGAGCQPLVNRVWRVVMWAQGEDAEQVKIDLRSPRCDLSQIVERTVDELLEICREKSPLVAAGMRVELFR